jgi:hypothetical protein
MVRGWMIWWGEFWWRMGWIWWGMILRWWSQWKMVIEFVNTLPAIKSVCEL